MSRGFSRVLVVVLLTSMASAALGGKQDASTGEEKPESRLEQAQRLFADRQYDEARRQARKASENALTEDQRRRADRLAALCGLLQGAPDAGEESERLLEEYPSLAEDAEFQVSQAVYYADRGEHQRAYDKYARAGKLFERQGSHRNAWQAYVAQAEIIRRFYDVIPSGFGEEARAWSPQQQERHAIEDAVAIYERAVDLEVGEDLRAEAIYRAGRTLAELSKWKFAQRGIEYYRQCVRDYSDTTAAATAQYELGQAYRKFERYTDAVREMERFIDRYGEHRRAPSVGRMLQEITSPQVELWSPGPVHLGRRPVLYWRSRNVQRLRLSASAVSLPEATSECDWFAPKVSFPEEAVGETVARWTVPIDDEGEHRWHFCATDAESGDGDPIEVPVDAPGAYRVRAVGEDGDSAAECLVVVSDLTTVAKADATETVVFAVRDDMPVVEADVSAAWLPYRRREPLFARGRTDEAGLARLDSLDAGRARRWLATARSGDHQSLCISEEHYWAQWGWQYAWRVYGFTDRGVYHKGDTVHYRQIVRAVDDGGYANRPGQEVRVDIRDPLGEVVYTRQHVTDEFGSFSGEWTPDADSPAGDYRINVSIGQLAVPFRDGGANVFRVLDADSSDLRLELRPARDSYNFGEEMKFVVRAVQADGTVSPETDLRLSIRKEPFDPATYLPDSSVSPASSGGVIQTDEQGEATITIEADGFQDAPHLGAKFVVTAFHGEAAARGVARAAGDAVRLAVSTDRGIYSAGEPVRVAVSATRADGAPRKATVKLTASGDREGVPRSFELTIEEEGGTTFIPPQPGRYMIRAQSPEAVADETSFIVTPGEGDVLPWQPEKLNIVASPGKLQTGDQLRLLVTAPFESGPVLVTGEANKLLFADSVNVSGGWTMVELPVTEDMSPNFTAVATAIRGGEVLSAETGVTVPPTHQLLNIDAEVVSGQSDRPVLRIKVTDARTGDPVAASATVSLVSGEPNIDRPSVEDAFYGFTRDVQVLTFDSSEALGKLTRRPADPRDRRRPERLRRDNRRAGSAPREQVRLDGVSPTETVLWADKSARGEDGIVELPAPLPDDGKPLTAWIVAVDKSNRVGSALVRLR